MKERSLHFNPLSTVRIFISRRMVNYWSSPLFKNNCELQSWRIRVVALSQYLWDRVSSPSETWSFFTGFSLMCDFGNCNLLLRSNLSCIINTLNYDSFHTFGDQFSFWEQRTRSLFVTNGSSPSFKSKLLWQVQLSAIALKALNR